MAHRIIVSEVTGHREVFRSDGERLREAIAARWLDGEPIEVDFENRVIASASFFDESFGMLALTYPALDLQGRLRPVNLKDADRRLLNDVIRMRIEERAERIASSLSGE